MELEENCRLPFLEMNIIRNGCHLDIMTVYRKRTDTRLLLYYHSHVDARYKRSLLNIMLMVVPLSSRRSGSFFTRNVNASKGFFCQLRYPDELVQFTIRRFIESKVSEVSQTQAFEKQDDQIRILLPFKDQKSANTVRRQLSDLNRKINANNSPVYSPVYTSRKSKDEIKSQGRQAAPCESTMRTRGVFS